MGTTVTWTSPVLPKFLNHTDDIFDEKITQDQASWIASWLILGMIAGNILYAYLTTALGRKTCFLTVAPLIIVSYMMMTFVNSIEVYYVARFLAGIGRIGGQTISLMYMTEIVSKSKRGSLMGYITTAVVLGCLYSYAVGPYVSVKVFNITLFIFPCISIVLFLIVGIETPHYYMIKGNKEMARKTLSMLRSKNENIEAELLEIEAKVTQMSNNNNNLVQSLKLRSCKVGFIVAIGLFFFQQLTGFFCIIMYNQQIFEMTGSALKSEICAIIIGSLQFLSGVFSSIVMDKFTRKSLLYFSAIGMAVSEIPLGLYCYLQTHGTNLDSVNFLPILLLSIFVLTYNVGYGSLPFIMPYEIFPQASKGFAVTMVGIFTAIINFVMAKYFQNAAAAMGGIGVLFIIFGVCCVISIPFVKFFVVETRGKSLEAIQDEINLKK